MLLVSLKKKSTFETKRHLRLLHFCFDKVANEGKRFRKLIKITDLDLINALQAFFVEFCKTKHNQHRVRKVYKNTEMRSYRKFLNIFQKLEKYTTLELGAHGI